MTAPLREQLKNNAITTLNGGINNSTTSIVVTDGSVFPSAGNFRITIGSEIMLCTARSTNTLTVVRGYEGTTGASASNGANVVLFLTAGNLSRWAQDNNGLWGLSASPPLGKLVDTNGSTLLTTSDFSWTNQGSTTVTDQNGTIIMDAPAAASENCRVQRRTAPSPTYSVIAAIQPCMVQEAFGNFGIGFRQSSSGKFSALALSFDNSAKVNMVAVYNFTDATTFSANGLARTNIMMLGNQIWMKITDNNTNLLYSISNDGSNWIQVLSVSRTAFMTSTGPDENFWYINNEGSSNYHALARLLHWSYV